MWRIKQIFDGEYGCEERPDEEKARCVVTLENERGERRELSVYDDWLKEKHLEEGSEWTAELFDICNEEGQPIGGMVERSHAHAEGICHRTAHVWVVRMVDGKYQVLLQKRAEDKESFPGCFDTSSAGHIQAGDEPLESAIRELEEELGIHTSPEQLNYAGKFHIHYEMEFHGHLFKDNETSFVFCYQEPVDMEKIKESSAYRIAPPSTGCCHNHNISMCESKISVLHDVLISIGYEIKNSDTLQILSVLAENNKTVLYDVITYLGRYLS